MSELPSASASPAGSAALLVELAGRAVALVAIASPPRPPRGRIEWLLTRDPERARQAVDLALAGGFLRELPARPGEQVARLALGRPLPGMRLPGWR